MLFIKKWGLGKGHRFNSKNPKDQSVVWEGNEASKDQIDAAIRISRLAFSDWQHLGVESRIEILLKFQSIVRANQTILSTTISQEVGKPLWESLNEVQTVISKIDISIDAFKDRCLEKSALISDKQISTRYKPHGVTSVIGPFNFPAHIPNGHIVPAILAGNCVLFKPSEHSPKVGELMMKYWEQAGLPAGVLSLIQGGKDVGKYISSHKGIDALFFTGSSHVGKLMLQANSTMPGKLLALEMGGNNAVVVEEIDNIPATVFNLIHSAYITSGQRCSCARRLIIIKNKQNRKLMDSLTQSVTHIRVGYYDDQDVPFMGPLINEDVAKRLLVHQEYLINSGAHPYVQMTPIKGAPNLLSPGLIDVSSLEVHGDDELFGPLLQVYWVDTLDDAIAITNQTNFGLSASLFSVNTVSFKRFYTEVRAGIINWNTPTTGASSLSPFGGVGDSGNHRPSAYFAADYCSYPIATIEKTDLTLPDQLSPGLELPS